VSPRRRARDMPERLILPAPAAPKPRRTALKTPEDAARIAVRRRTKPSAVPGNVRLVLNLDIPRELAERLSARVIREGKNFDALVLEALEVGAP